jgi:antitoxin ParD1/3/4
MSRNTSIFIGDYYDKFISSKVASGKYNSVSEVIRSALRLLEEQEEKISLLKKELKKGEKSGFVKDFDPAKLLKNLHENH